MSKPTHAGLPSNRSKLLQTALSVIDGYNSWSLSEIASPRTKDCTQQCHPMSLKGPLYTSPEEYCEYYKTMIPLFRNFKMEVIGYAEDQTQNKVIFHAMATAETDVGPYENEFVWMIQTTQDQDKVCGIREFLDSAYTVDFLKKMWERMQEEGKTTWG
ncbi:uncharacterized protein BCR38DRAFT_404282 [Pseudomassariella vexata]|uniref:SnoaL-like domain-containing protein n=1 Tax=Pseudomassariella vexata TaxID=1141098 RepID=A0A1Y2EHY0_9PEZI|nr:uncharacterized protein BCR38DRAFT_404282 [Pseudomassariella vexata]ORY71163.1 hypothetical protein BCR38DRAFT_404282 [Pseudomassariella vexata]